MVNGLLHVKGQLIPEWQWMPSFEPNKNENVSVFLPYLSKIGQIKNQMQSITLEDK